jgi:bile acid-coenzyme A ligase
MADESTRQFDLGSFDPETPLSDALRLLAEAAPQAPSVTFNAREGGETTVTRSELEARTTRLARVFASCGVEHGSMVTIALPNSIAVYEATIACWKVGAIPQPVSHRLPPAELEALVDLADPALVIGLDPGDGRPVLPPHFQPDPSLPDDPLPPAVSPAWKAPTSGGSTGRPKIIVSGHGATLRPLVLSATRVGIEPRGVLLCTGPLSHNAP